jgi:NADP-dependent 3-hydroxy acid dehydrogenase YdfG
MLHVRPMAVGGSALMGNRVDGLVAIITGAGTGIGEATAEEFGAAGVHVVVVGRRANLVERVAERIRAAGGGAIAEPGDVRDFARMEAIVERTVERWGKIDVFVANAAVVEESLISDGDPARWKELIDTNVTGALNSVRAVLPTMHRQGSGHIVIVASVSGRVTYVGQPAYVASKHALVALGEVLRQEVAAKKLRVTLVEPGVVLTPFVNPEYLAELLPGVTPLSATDIARTIRFAIEQPPNVSINEIVIRPTGQLL